MKSTSTRGLLASIDKRVGTMISLVKNEEDKMIKEKEFTDAEDVVKFLKKNARKNNFKLLGIQKLNTIEKRRRLKGLGCYQFEVTKYTVLYTQKKGGN